METHNDTPVKLMIYPAIVFMVIGMSVGVFMAFNSFLFPDYFSGEYIHFGRIRPVHVWHVLFLWLLSADVGLVLFFVPRLCGIKLWNLNLAYIAIALWWSSLIVTVYSYPTGTNSGWEYAEIPSAVSWIPVKPMLILAWVLFATNVFMTIANRKFEKMFVSLWYTMAAMIWTTFSFFAGWYAINWVPEGISRVNANFFYIHNLVGLIFTPLGVASAYYFLPKLSNKPIYSHQLSMIGFWTVAMVYSWVGTHHLIHGPISQWLQTTAIVFSLWIFIPVLSVVVNLFATLRNNWDLYSKSAAIRFLIMGNGFYLITCIQGPMMGLRNVNEITSKTDWVIGHSHISLYGTFTYWALAAIYFVIPVITKKPIWSNRLSNWHFALNLWGSLPFMLSVWIGGFLQGMMWATWADGSTYAEFHNNLANLPFLDTVAEMQPWWLMRAIGGIMILFGNILFVFNMFNTILLKARPQPELESNQATT